MKFVRHQVKIHKLDMTPMIDIVFQLIAFFMLVTNFEQSQADERVKLPIDQLAKPPLVAREKEIVLNIGFVRDKQGNIIQPDPVIFLADEQIPVAGIRPQLDLERQVAQAKYGDEALADMTIVIRADSDVPTGLVQELIRTAQDVGFEDFALKAMQEQDY